MHQYNTYMGGVDTNDQLLKYSAYSRRCSKWWEKVAFRLLNVAMVNAYVLYKEWCQKTNVMHKKRLSHTDFRISVIKQLLSTITDNANILHDTPDVTKFSRLGGRHFMSKIPSDDKQKVAYVKYVVKVIYCTSGAPPKRKMVKLRYIGARIAKWNFVLVVVSNCTTLTKIM